METGGFIVLAVGAVLIALVIDAVAIYVTAQRQIGDKVILTIIGAAIGGFVASEYLGSLGEWGYEYDGLYVVPAEIGAFVAGLLVELAIRFREGRIRTLN